MRVSITLEVEEGSEWADPGHEMGISEHAWQRLTGETGEYGPPPLLWLGEVQDVEKV